MKAKSVYSCHEAVKSFLWTLFALCMTPFYTFIWVSLALCSLNCKYWIWILQKYWSEKGNDASLCIKNDGLTWQHKGLWEFVAHLFIQEQKCAKRPCYDCIHFVSTLYTWVLNIFSLRMNVFLYCINAFKSNINP
jgi:hypothetical protein